MLRESDKVISDEIAAPIRSTQKKGHEWKTQCPFLFPLNPWQRQNEPMPLPLFFENGPVIQKAFYIY